MKKGSRKRKKLFKNISKVIWIISIIILAILLFFIYKANILPIKYFLIIVGVFVLLSIIHGFIILRKKAKIGHLVVLDLLVIPIIALEIFALVKINDTLSFLEKINVKYEVYVYNIVVNKDSNYKDIDDIKGKTIYAVKDTNDMSLLEDKVNNKIEYQEEITTLISDLIKDKEIVAIINSGSFESLLSIDDKLEDKVRILDTIEVKTKVDEENINIDVTKNPFVIYLSGIDTRSNYMPARSLSDVNIILAVNPNTKNILMVHIPRDAYVQIHNTTGLKDKLTHAGTRGGIKLSMATIEDLLEIDIPYYIRVNFNAVVDLVNAIGGINIYSDVNYSFTCWTDSSCSFNSGYNFVKGKCALAFARERHAYETGDRHRGENQEQVMQLIIDKITSSKTLISNYNKLLDALEGSFQTSIPPEKITSLVKMQINDMSSWHIETYNLTGVGDMTKTLSYPGRDLYVFHLDSDSINEAVNKLNEVLGEK